MNTSEDELPRTSGDGRRARRGSRRRGQANGRPIVEQITEIVAANEALQRENQELAAENAELQAQLREISMALGRLTGAGQRRRGRLTPDTAADGAERPRRKRKPITDPEVLEKRRQALAKARAARAERLAARRAEGAGAEQA
jgi:hypothetical protein